MLVRVPLSDEEGVLLRWMYESIKCHWHKVEMNLAG